MNEVPASPPASDDPKPARPQLFGAPASENGTAGTSLLAAIDGSHASRPDGTRSGKGKGQWLFAGGLAVLVGGLVYVWAQDSQPSASSALARNDKPAQPAPAALQASQAAAAQVAETASSAPAAMDSSAAAIVAASDITQPAAAALVKPAETSASAPSVAIAGPSAPPASAPATSMAAAQAAPAAVIKSDSSSSSRSTHKAAQAAAHKDKAGDKSMRTAHAGSKPTTTATARVQHSSGSHADKKATDAVSSDADLLAAMLPYLRRQPGTQTVSSDKKSCSGGEHAQGAERCTASAASAPSR